MPGFLIRVVTLACLGCELEWYFGMVLISEVLGLIAVHVNI